MERSTGERQCRKLTKLLGVVTVVQRGTDVCSNCHDENTAPAIVNGHVGKDLYGSGCSYPVLVLTKHINKSDPRHSIGEVCQ